MYLRQYETITLVDPRTGAEGVEKVLARMREALSKTEGREVRFENWGRRNTAYRLQTYRIRKAHYLYLNFLAGNTTVGELERLLKITEEAMLYQTVMLRDRVQVDDFDFEEAATTQTAHAKSEEEIDYSDPVEEPVVEAAPAEEAAKAAPADKDEAADAS